MGREVRRVPATWQHPMEKKRDALTGCFVDRYKPLVVGEHYQTDGDEWDEACAKWKSGWRPDYCTDPEDRNKSYEQYAGQRPHRDDYMPNWPAEERTHLMMYENTSEGTPISPAFETAEELARWLVDNKASAFGSELGSYEGWMRTIELGWAPSMVFTSAGVTSGVESLAGDCRLDGGPEEA